jgi:N-acyl-D-amino-acid deacylase
MVNPDGGGPVNLARQRDSLLEHGLGVNVGLMIGHGSVRGNVMGPQDREPTAEELERMKSLVRTGMEQGAFGLSSGVFYSPGSFARTPELIALARVAAAHGGVYQSHIRDESDYTIGVVASVEEVIQVAREAKLPGIVTHIKALGPRVWGYSETIVERIEQARAAGIEVWADQYPYTASSTGLSSALVPRWAQEGGRAAFAQRMSDPDTRARIREEMIENLDRRGGSDRIQFVGGSSTRGKTLARLAEEREQHPIDVALSLLQSGSPSIISHNMNEEDVSWFMRQPWTMTASDGGLSEPGSSQPHPRGYGTFPRRIRFYTLERNVTDLPTAIRSMTHLPASVYRMKDRGILREGAFADIVVFDLARVNDPATFEDPHQIAEGMVCVLVNGGVAMDGGAFTDGLHGRVLRR